eukprot:4410380-Amphidinium_carterae.1
MRPGALLHYHRLNGWQSHLLLIHHSASRMWQWHDLSGKPPWHSAPKITPALLGRTCTTSCLDSPVRTVTSPQGEIGASTPTPAETGHLCRDAS